MSRNSKCISNFSKRIESTLSILACNGLLIAFASHSTHLNINYYKRLDTAGIGPSLLHTKEDHHARTTNAAAYYYAL